MQEASEPRHGVRYLHQVLDKISPCRIEQSRACSQAEDQEPTQAGKSKIGKMSEKSQSQRQRQRQS
eukprot:757508-Hanusia_phi.AAC.9